MIILQTSCCAPSQVNEFTKDTIDELPGNLSAKQKGLACLPCLHQPDALLIVYDRPDPARMVGKDALWADIFRLPAK